MTAPPPVAAVREILEYRPASRVSDGPDRLLDRVTDGVSLAAAAIGAPPEIGLRGRVDPVDRVVRRDIGFMLPPDPARLSFPVGTPP